MKLRDDNNVTVKISHMSEEQPPQTKIKRNVNIDSSCVKCATFLIVTIE